MRSSSSATRLAMTKPTTQRKSRIKVGNQYYDVYNVNYYQDCYEDGNVIGNAIAGQLEFDIPYMEKFDEFTFYDGIWVEESQDYLYIDFGHFKVFDDKDNDEFTKHIVAYDNLIEFNAPYTANSSYPITLYEELENICNQAGILLDNQSIPNGDFIIENNQFVNDETLKSVLKAICQISGCYAMIKNNKLRLQLYGDASYAIGKSQHEPMTWKRKTYGINQVILGNENVVGEYSIREDAEDIELNGVHKLVINDNPFAYTQSKREQLIDDLFDQVHLFGYIPYELKGEWLSFLEIGDGLTIDGTSTILLRVNGHSPNALNSEMSAPAIIDSSLEYANNTETINNRMKRTEIIVDKNTQEIAAIAEKVEDVSKEVEGVGEVFLEKASSGYLHRLEIRGNLSKVFPNDQTRYGYPLMISNELIVGNDVYISEGIPYQNKDATYPSSTLYPKESYIQVGEELYHLDLEYLNYINESVHDKYICEDGKQWIERNVGINAQGQMYALPRTIIEQKPDLYISLEGETTITLLSFESAVLKVEYMLENQYTRNFATKVYVDSSIRQTTDEIEAKVSAVSDEQGEITAASIKLAINQDSSEIKIDADNVNINGIVSANENFQIDLEGNMTCNDANINGDIITPNGVLTNLQFGCELWGWTNANAFNNFSGGFVGYNFDMDEQAVPSYLNFSVRIPENFTVKSAKVHLRHSPVSWASSDAQSYQNGSCKNMKVYNASGLGQSGYAAYYSEFIIGGTAPYLSALATEPASMSFSDTTFEEKTFDIPIETFDSAGTHNIVIKTSDAVPTGVTWQNAYQKLGSQTGILTGVLEIIGYTNNI